MICRLISSGNLAVFLTKTKFTVLHYIRRVSFQIILRVFYVTMNLYMSLTLVFLSPEFVVYNLWKCQVVM